MRFSDVRRHVFSAALVIFIILTLVASYTGSYPDRLGARAHIDLTQVAYTPTMITIFPIYIYVTTTTTATTTVFSTNWRWVTEISFITSTTRESIYLTETRVIPPPIFSVNPMGWGTSTLVGSIFGAAAVCVCFITVLRRWLCSGFWRTWRPPHLDTSVVDLRDKKEPLIPRIPEGEPEPVEPPPRKEPEPVKEPPKEAPPKEKPKPIEELPREEPKPIEQPPPEKKPVPVQQPPVEAPPREEPPKDWFVDDRGNIVTYPTGFRPDDSAESAPPDYLKELAEKRAKSEVPRKCMNFGCRNMGKPLPGDAVVCNECGRIVL